MQDTFDAISAWWKQPFNANGTVLNWALFLGLVIVLVFAWTQVLRFIVEETEG